MLITSEDVPEVTFALEPNFDSGILNYSCDATNNGAWFDHLSITMVRNTETETYFGMETQNGLRLGQLRYYDTEDNSLGSLYLALPPGYVDDRTRDSQTYTASGKKAAAKIIAELYVHKGSQVKTYTVTIYKTPNNQ